MARLAVRPQKLSLTFHRIGRVAATHENHALNPANASPCSAPQEHAYEKALVAELFFRCGVEQNCG